MMSIDQAETRRRDLSQEDRSREVGCLDSGVLQPCAAAVIRDLRQLDGLGREAFRVGGDKRNEARDVELEDAVGVELIARLGCAGLKLGIAPKGDGFPCWYRSGASSHASSHCYPRPPAKSGTKTGTNCYFGPGTHDVRRKKSPIKSMVGVTGFEPATPTSRRLSASVLIW